MTRLILLASAALVLAACAPREVTRSEIHRLRPLMTCGEVTAVIGSPGRLVAPDEHMPGLLHPTSDHEVVYLWKNDDGSLLSVAFRDGRLTAMNEYNF